MNEGPGVRESVQRPRETEARSGGTLAPGGAKCKECGAVTWACSWPSGFPYPAAPSWILSFLLLLLSSEACGLLVSRPGMEPTSLQWILRVLIEVEVRWAPG